MAASAVFQFQGTSIPLGQVIQNGKFHGRVIRKFQADLAEARLDRAQAQGVFPKDKKQYVTKVDWRVVPNESGGEKKVDLDGNIRYIRFGAEDTATLVPAMLEMIRLIMRKVPFAKKGNPGSRVPFRTRHYLSSFAMMRNNVMVVGPGPRFRERARGWIRKNGAALTDKDTLGVTNIQPYARRIEEGAHFQKPWSRQNSRGVFNQARAEGIRSRKTAGLYISRVEYGPLPGAVSNMEYNSQGAVTYAEGKNFGAGKNRRFKYSGRVMRKHRVYPILFFGPPRVGAGYGMNRSQGRWTNRANQYQVMGNTEASRQTIASQIRRHGGLIQ